MLSTSKDLWKKENIKKDPQNIEHFIKKLEKEETELENNNKIDDKDKKLLNRLSDVINYINKKDVRNDIFKDDIAGEVVFNEALKNLYNDAYNKFNNPDAYENKFLDNIRDNVENTIDKIKTFIDNFYKKNNKGKIENYNNVDYEKLEKEVDIKKQNIKDDNIKNNDKVDNAFKKMSENLISEKKEQELKDLTKIDHIIGNPFKNKEK